MDTRIIITGSRDFDDYKLLKRIVLAYIDLNAEHIIISGNARGADRLGEKFAQEYNINLKQVPANWNAYGKSAGYIRNKEMVEFASKGNGILIAFWDGKSKGTKRMIKLARQYKLTVIIINYAILESENYKSEEDAKGDLVDIKTGKE